MGYAPEAAEASLQAEYGRDILADYLKGKITLRRLRVLLQGLPGDSYYVREMFGPVWDDHTWLTYSAATDIRGLLYSFVKANSDQPVPAPEVIPYPGMEEDEDVRDPELNAESARNTVLMMLGINNEGDTDMLMIGFKQ